MLQFFTKSWAYIKTIESHGFEYFRYDDVNTVSINENPEPYLNTLCYVYVDNECVGSGIVAWYYHKKNENVADLSVIPRTIDLNCTFVRLGNYNADIANVIEDFIGQYNAATGAPVLYMKEKNLTGIQFRFSFEEEKTLKEAWDFVVGKFAGENASVYIDTDGGVIIRNSANSHNLTYGNDILRIEYEKDMSEIVNFVKFTNGKDGADLIELTRSDTESITKYGKKVMFISDERFAHVASVHEYIDRIFEKKAHPVIRVQSITTLRKDIAVYDTISISNWEKNLPDNMVVHSVVYMQNGSVSLDVGTKMSREEDMVV